MKIVCKLDSFEENNLITTAIIDENLLLSEELDGNSRIKSLKYLLELLKFTDIVYEYACTAFSRIALLSPAFKKEQVLVLPDLLTALKNPSREVYKSALAVLKSFDFGQTFHEDHPLIQAILVLFSKEPWKKSEWVFDNRFDEWFPFLTDEQVAERHFLQSLERCTFPEIYRVAGILASLYSIGKDSRLLQFFLKKMHTNNEEILRIACRNLSRLCFSYPLTMDDPVIQILSGITGANIRKCNTRKSACFAIEQLTSFMGSEKNRLLVFLSNKLQEKSLTVRLQILLSMKNMVKKHPDTRNFPDSELVLQNLENAWYQSKQSSRAKKQILEIAGFLGDRPDITAAYPFISILRESLQDTNDKIRGIARSSLGKIIQHLPWEDNEKTIHLMLGLFNDDKEKIKVKKETLEFISTLYLRDRIRPEVFQNIREGTPEHFFMNTFIICKEQLKPTRSIEPERATPKPMDIEDMDADLPGIRYS